MILDPPLPVLTCVMHGHLPNMLKAQNAIVVKPILHECLRGLIILQMGDISAHPNTFLLSNICYNSETCTSKV